ncbi:MAG: NADH-quinone oxidoreductase subunit H [Prevotellaceae bacterium]|jgi:formate hydrogenlyase subunit 4|nr:NADH-quinone oxidoreductase subunit H [Prevotellaceae bacterium]
MLSVLLILAFAAVFHGILGRTRSILSGRKGPKILQTVYNLVLLFRKGEVISVDSGKIFQLAPAVSFVAVLIALLMAPFGKCGTVISFPGDFVLFAYLLALGRFAMILGALDTASSFEGMGAAREALYGMLAEPAFFVLAGTFAMLTGHNSFAEIFGFFDMPSLSAAIPGMLAAFAFFLMLLVETGRLPVDDPRTHLELTMVHEVMILDYSGFDLALIHITTCIKAAVYSTLTVLCVVPGNLHTAIYMPLFIVLILLVPVITGFFESFRARNRLHRNPSYILTMTVMAIVSFVTAAIVFR